MKTIGIVIARQGSRRVQGKNERMFCGHPLVAWSIVQSICSHGIEATFLSTDGDNLEAIGKQYGAEVIRRPDWGDADYVPANVPYMHALRILREVYPELETCVFYLATNPLRLPHDTDRLLKVFRETKPWPGRATQVTPIVPQPETIVYGMFEPNYCYYKMWDKHWNYATQGGGMHVSAVREYMEINQRLADERWTDAMIDNLAQNNSDFYNRDIMHTDVMRYVPLEVWQQFEIDEEPQFKLCEGLMEAFILKGKGMDVYHEYAKEKPSAD